MIVNYSDVIPLAGRGKRSIGIKIAPGIGQRRRNINICTHARGSQPCLPRRRPQFAYKLLNNHRNIGRSIFPRRIIFQHGRLQYRKTIPRYSRPNMSYTVTRDVEFTKFYYSPRINVSR